jgi:hypothetical protein
VAKRLSWKSRRLLKKLLRLNRLPIRPPLRLTQLLLRLIRPLRRLKAPLRPIRNISYGNSQKLATSRPKGRLVCYWGVE